MKFLGVSQKEEKSFYKTVDTTPGLLAQSTLNLRKTFNIKKYTHVRLSELSIFCPREYAIGFKYGKARESYTEYPLMQQFEIGSALHFWYQNFSKVFKDVLYGYWKCWACGKLRGKDRPFFGVRDEVKKTPCEHCGASGDATFYYEYYFRIDEPYRVVGKIDGFILKGDSLYIMDIKSFFEESNFPKLQDKVQLMGYMLCYDYLPEELRPPVKVNCEEGILYYVSKKFSHNASILSYLVEKEEETVTKIKENLSLFTESTKTGELPPPFDSCVRNKWSKGKAKNCYLSDLCRELYEG